MGYLIYQMNKICSKHVNRKITRENEQMVVYKLGRGNVKKNSRIYGPVLMKRYTGEFENIKANIEIWPLSNTGKLEDDFVIEVSFKTNEESIATKQRELLMASLEKKGWLLPKDSLKTELIFQ